MVQQWCTCTFSPSQSSTESRSDQQSTAHLRDPSASARVTIQGFTKFRVYYIVTENCLRLEAKEIEKHVHE